MLKHGRIFHLTLAPNRSTHCQVPTPYVFNNFIRIYYSCRNNGKAFIAYFDLAKDLRTILKVHEQPILEKGKPGMFDADGVMPSCVIENSGELWMYYIGWNELKNTARYQNEIGLAISKDGGDTFQRAYEGPIMGRSRTQPGLAVMPFILKDDRDYFMYYQSGTGWHNINGKYEPTYVIKHAVSCDGVYWIRNPHPCIPNAPPLEAFSRPAVIKDGDVYKMYYCCRGGKDYRGGQGSYRIGYADSEDGVSFTRKDHDAGLELGAPGEWDSEMQCYPYVFSVDGKLVMLYNGDGFGQTGIGLAKWE